MREGFFDFVAPDDGGGHSIGDVECAGEGCVWVSDVSGEDGAHIESQEREVPFGGDCFSDEGFSAPLNADEEDAFRGFESEVASV